MLLNTHSQPPPVFVRRNICAETRLRWGGVAVFGDGGVMSSGTRASDPSVREDADTSPAKLGRRHEGEKSWRVRGNL